MFVIRFKMRLLQNSQAFDPENLEVILFSISS